MDTGNFGKPAKNQKTTVAKVVETGFLIATWLALGLYLEIYGPTQIDLKLKLNTDYESIAVAFSGRSIGLFPGCVFGGVLVDKLGKYCHLMLALCLDVAAVVTAIVPWSPNVTVLWVLCFIGGIVESVINIAGQRLILKLWLDKSATPMILLHSGYGVGSFLIPLYTNPFLAVERPNSENSYSNTTVPDVSATAFTGSSAGVLTSTEKAVQYMKDSRIEYSYLISAILVALHSVSFFVFQYRERQYYDQNRHHLNHSKDAKPNNVFQSADSDKPDSEDERTFIQIINPATCTEGRFLYGLVLFFLMFLYCGNAGGGERVVAGFIRSFSVDQLGFSKDDASYLNTSFWISFTIGRVLFSLAAKWVSIRLLILIETCGLTVIAVLLNFLARNNTLAYWILVQPLGIFIAPLWPSLVAWSDHHLELTGVGMMVLLLGGSVGGFSHLRLIGFLYEHFGPYTFLYQIIGYGCLALILAILLDLVGGIHGNRFKRNKLPYQDGKDGLKSEKKNENATEKL